VIEKVMRNSIPRRKKRRRGGRGGVLTVAKE